jgi:hypothetical protein
MHRVSWAENGRLILGQHLSAVHRVWYEGEKFAAHLHLGSETYTAPELAKSMDLSIQSCCANLKVAMFFFEFMLNITTLLFNTYDLEKPPV